MNKIIKKIELDLSGKTVSLTPEQARRLKEALDELFGKDVIREVHEHHRYPWWEYHYWKPYYSMEYTTAGNTAIWRNDTSTLKLTA